MASSSTPTSSTTRLPSASAPPQRVDQIDDNTPIVQVVQRIITQAVRQRASDVHVEPQEGKVRIRFRVDGALHDAAELPPSIAQALSSRIKIMAEMNIVERRRSQDGQFEMTVDGRPLDIRVATMATIWGEKVVLRLLDRSRSLFQLERARHVGAGAGRLLALDPVTVRHGDPGRSDREREDHHALRRAEPDRQSGAQHHHHRRPGGVRVPRDQPDPDQRAGRHHLRRRPQGDPAPGPRRDPRRRDARRRDRSHRGPVRAHRPPRALVAPRHRLHGRAAPVPRHGHRVVPRLVVGRRRDGATPRAPNL